MQPYQRLERLWAEYHDLNPSKMVVCSSGTAALHLALEALQLPLGCEVIVPNYTMIACARAVTLSGHTPVFVDCRFNNLLMDPSILLRCVSPSTRVVMPVHVYGRQCDMDKVSYFSRNQGCYVIEDLAEAHCMKPHTLTNVACWSFYHNKIIGAYDDSGEGNHGEGGAVYFELQYHANIARELRNIGFSEPHTYLHSPRGHNYRLSNCHANLIIDSLSNHKVNYSMRRSVERFYNDHCVDRWEMSTPQSPWVYSLRIRGMSSVRQDYLVSLLNKEGIGARHGFKPMSTQKEYQGCRAVNSVVGGVSCALVASREVIYLPLWPNVTEELCSKAMRIIKDNLNTES